MSRIIKKYPNRRLYDTHESRYITLADIRGLVHRQVEFTVIDKKSGDDITRAILLQVICEQELSGNPVLSESFLANLIRAGDEVSPEFLSRHLDKSLASFRSQENHPIGQAPPAPGANFPQQLSDEQQKAG